METTFSGKISANFTSYAAIEDLCLRHIPSYNPQTLQIVAIRVFAGPEFVLTVYAEDKAHDTSLHPGKTMVKKFKILNLAPSELLSCIQGFNFTLFQEAYQGASIEVINK